MKIKLEPGAYMPERKHDTDAGLDIKAMHGQRVMPGGSAVFRTGVHVELPAGCAGLLVSKSGLNIKHDITSTGLIDEGFRERLGSSCLITVQILILSLPVTVYRSWLSYLCDM